MMSNMKLVVLMMVVLHKTCMSQTVTGPYQGETSLYCNYIFENITTEGIRMSWWKNDSGKPKVMCNFGQKQKMEEDLVCNGSKCSCNGTNFGITLVLKNLTLKDAGLYFCEVWSEGSNEHARDSVNLSVAAKPSVQTFTSKEDNSFVFNASGWFPKPSVRWTDEKNQDWTHSAVTKITEGKDGLYNIDTVLHTTRTLHTAKLHLSYINPNTGEEQTDVLQRDAVTVQNLTVWIIVGSSTGIVVGAFIAIAARKCQHKISSGGAHDPLEGADESFSGSTPPRLPQSSSYESLDGTRPVM
ncbi:hypothetical protein AGOR_G00235480 [Albula goreensis]|uniref:Ig-like domain-containing protein n=1 Tax=Albula goreensis TaxID=1534307 RepID=A0A8T3CJZ2_9TELE|nr:hypothetical protein AGOR_G00235480 [Albula goreensis]